MLIFLLANLCAIFSTTTPLVSQTFTLPKRSLTGKRKGNILHKPEQFKIARVQKQLSEAILRDHEYIFELLLYKERKYDMLFRISQDLLEDIEFSLSNKSRMEKLFSRYLSLLTRKLGFQYRIWLVHSQHNILPRRMPHTLHKPMDRISEKAFNVVSRYLSEYPDETIALICEYVAFYNSKKQ